jgi:flagellin
MLAQHNRAIEQSFERLATGKRVNRASDDPTAIAPIEQFKARRNELATQLKSIEREQAYLGARDGYASVISDQLIELQSVVVQAANTSGLSQQERRALQDQADSILAGIDFLSNTFTHQGVQIGQGTNAQTLGLAGMRRGGALDLLTGDLKAAQEAIDAAVESHSGGRASVGARTNDLESQRRSLMEEMINTADAQSMLEDTDYAKETAELVRAQALQQFAMFVQKLSQDQNASTVLALLQGVKPAA